MADWCSNQGKATNALFLFTAAMAGRAILTGCPYSATAAGLGLGATLGAAQQVPDDTVGFAGMMKLFKVGKKLTKSAEKGAKKAVTKAAERKAAKKAGESTPTEAE